MVKYTVDLIGIPPSVSTLALGDYYARMFVSKVSTVRIVNEGTFRRFADFLVSIRKAALDDVDYNRLVDELIRYELPLWRLDNGVSDSTILYARRERNKFETIKDFIDDNAVVQIIGIGV